MHLLIKTFLFELSKKFSFLGGSKCFRKFHIIYNILCQLNEEDIETHKEEINEFIKVLQEVYWFVVFECNYHFCGHFGRLKSS